MRTCCHKGYSQSRVCAPLNEAATATAAYERERLITLSRRLFRMWSCAPPDDDATANARHKRLFAKWNDFSACSERETANARRDLHAKMAIRKVERPSVRKTSFYLPFAFEKKGYSQSCTCQCSHGKRSPCSRWTNRQSSIVSAGAALVISAIDIVWDAETNPPRGDTSRLVTSKPFNERGIDNRYRVGNEPVNEVVGTRIKRFFTISERLVVYSVYVKMRVGCRLLCSAPCTSRKCIISLFCPVRECPKAGRGFQKWSIITCVAHW